MEYTKGEWKVGEDEEGGCWIRIPEGHDLFFGNMEDVDSCCFANAELIAHSPRLLEALRNLMQRLDNHFGLSPECDWIEQETARKVLFELSGIK